MTTASLIRDEDGDYLLVEGRKILVDWDGEPLFAIPERKHRMSDRYTTLVARVPAPEVSAICMTALHIWQADLPSNTSKNKWAEVARAAVERIKAQQAKAGLT